MWSMVGTVPSKLVGYLEINLPKLLGFERYRDETLAAVTKTVEHANGVARDRTNECRTLVDYRQAAQKNMLVWTLVFVVATFDFALLAWSFPLPTLVVSIILAFWYLQRTCPGWIQEVRNHIMHFVGLEALTTPFFFLKPKLCRFTKQNGKEGFRYRFVNESDAKAKLLTRVEFSQGMCETFPVIRVNGKGESKSIDIYVDNLKTTPLEEFKVKIVGTCPTTNKERVWNTTV